MIQVADIRTMQQFSVPAMTLHSLSMQFRRQRHLLSTSTAPRCQWNLQSSFVSNCQKHFVSSSYVTRGTLIQEKHVNFHVIHCLLRIENLSVFESLRLGCDLIVFRLSLFVVYLASWKSMMLVHSPYSLSFQHQSSCSQYLSLKLRVLLRQWYSWAPRGLSKQFEQQVRNDRWGTAFSTNFSRLPIDKLTILLLKVFSVWWTDAT